MPRRNYILVIFSIIFSFIIYFPARGQSGGKLSIDTISARITLMRDSKDRPGLMRMAHALEIQIKGNPSDSLNNSDYFYYSGVCSLLSNYYSEALVNLLGAYKMKSSLGLSDNRYLKCLYNLGVLYNILGDFNSADNYYTKYISEAKRLHGENSYEAISAYSVRLGALIENNDFEKLGPFTEEVLEAVKKSKDVLSPVELGDLYQNFGLVFYHIADYAKVRVYLEMALDCYERSGITASTGYINLINNLASIYGLLGLKEKEAEFFLKGIALAVDNNSYSAFNLINTYALILGKSGSPGKGEKLLEDVVVRAGKVYGRSSRNYVTILMNYAEYIRDYGNDPGRSLPYFKICMEYVDSHMDDESLRDPVITGYALALSETGVPEKALEIIQDLLFLINEPENKEYGLFENPDRDSLKADNRIVKILRTKHEILKKLSTSVETETILKALASTSESIIALVENIRINISEEESRIVLGNRYRDLYINAIYDFYKCYSRTGETLFLEKVFEYSERCKVASLLAATRELSATEFHIPPELASLEYSVQREIGYINSRISEENEKENPDKQLLSSLNSELLPRIQKRDSLVADFEKNYPEYYSLKYNIESPGIKDIPSITGRNTNYLNYVISDSLLYIFLINRKTQKLVVQHIDSAFFAKMGQFTHLLSNPSKTDKAGSDFKDYQETGTYLYEYLIKPVCDNFISDKLLISPDNILSYIPFEVLLTKPVEGTRILYRELKYLMYDYNISYAYSATFIRENNRRKFSGNSHIIAFAPVYHTNINIDSLFVKRQTGGRYLIDLPYSREEAKYITSLIKGTLCVDNEATESEFKKTAPGYGIIHLAMHTVLNDANPMNSAMLFSLEGDPYDDGLLHTYEVYGLELNAKMVVLSSCNTGSGVLSTGEGILSLARGFIYSGSQSVVMSMWEIDDKTGTDIIKMFYNNLKKGMSKSSAIKNARIKYLKSANQFRSHPYFWSSLVIYGDDSKIFTGSKLILVAAAVFLCAVFVFLYFRKQKYS